MLETTFGNYRILCQLGEGGMGVVYAARHATLGRRAAVKVLQPELSSNADMVQRFFNEAQAAAAIRNPGIVQVFDFGTTPDGCAFLVMELLEGETLTTRLAQHRLDVEACCRIGRQIANVLQAAHAQGITHRDLKPDNLFLVPDGEVTGGVRVKVLDFGIAKLAGELQAVGVKTRTGVLMGTPMYMSPEQCRGAVAAEPRSDIYSLGCILFEMACGQPPFVGHGVGEMLGAHLYTPPPHPQSLAPELPPSLAQLILHLLAKQPGERPQTMRAVSQALEEILQTLGTPSPRRAPTPLPVPDDPPAASAHDSMPRLAHASTPPQARAPTPLPFPGSGSGSAPEIPLPGLAPATPFPDSAPAIPLPGSVPASAHAPTMLAWPRPSSASPASTTISGSAGTSDARPRARRRRLPWLLGGIAGAALMTVLAITTATGLTAEPASPAPPQISYGEIASGAAGPDAEAAPSLEPPPAPAVVDAAVGVAEDPAPARTADELEAGCRAHERARRWAELEQCARELRSLAPQRAGELEHRAVEEIKAARRIAGVEAALRNKELKRARLELGQVWSESVAYASIKGKYELAEAQAITALVAQLKLVSDADCQEFNDLLVKERASKPGHVMAEAARRAPCEPVVTCLAEAHADRGQAEFAAGRFAAALAFYEAAYACKAAPQWSERAFVVACNLRDRAKAKLHWKRLPSGMQSRALGVCVRNGISKAMLDAP